MVEDDLALLGVLSLANAFARRGNYDAGIALMESTLGDDCGAPAVRSVARLYMRLASLYRLTGRFSDEADLLERFKRLYPDDRQRARADARLSKVLSRLAAARGSVPLVLCIAGTRKPRRSSLAIRLDQRARAHADRARMGRAPGGVELEA